MEEKDIPDLNIFMMCEKYNKSASRKIPKGYHIRKLRKDELETWFLFPFDTIDGDKTGYLEFMKEYFKNVYSSKSEIFYNSCLVVCNNKDIPIATCFAWKAYNKYWTIHWFKTLKTEEGKGLGRSILTEVMNSIPENEFPVYLHTQPGSFRAIKIYSDFGFKILTDDFIGTRKNNYKESIKFLKHFMKQYYDDLEFAKSDEKFSNVAKLYDINEF